MSDQSPRSHVEIERGRILDMVQRRQITAAEGERLLAVLHPAAQGPGGEAVSTTPGRALDIVHAAVEAAGRRVYAIDVQIGHRGTAGPEMCLYLIGGMPTSAEVLAIFAGLGVPPSSVTFRATPDRHHAVASAGILGDCGLRVITPPEFHLLELPDDMPEPSDPTALIAAVDAARAAAG